MTALDPKDADRFAKLIALLGSDQPGERDAATLKATAFLKKRKLGWTDVAIMLRHDASDDRPSLGDHRCRARHLLRSGEDLGPWARSFLQSIARWNGPLSEKQLATLRDIEGQFAASDRDAA